MSFTITISDVAKAAGGGRQAVDCISLATGITLTCDNKI
jgi:hypothetical protein